MRAVTCFIGFFLIILFAAPTLADYYRYKDASGTPGYTDRLENIPPEYRHTAVKLTLQETDKNRRPVIRNESRQIKPQVTAVTVESSPLPTQSSEIKFRWNWLFLAVFLLSGFVCAGVIEKRRMIAFSYRFRVGTVFAALLLGVVFNMDIARKTISYIEMKYKTARQAMAEQEAKDKKPLKTLSDKVDDMVNQVSR